MSLLDLLKPLTQFGQTFGREPAALPTTKTELPSMKISEPFSFGGASAPLFSYKDIDKILLSESSGNANAIATGVDNKTYAGSMQVGLAAWTDVNKLRKKKGLPVYDYEKYKFNPDVNREYGTTYINEIVPGYLESKKLPVTKANAILYYKGYLNQTTIPDSVSKLIAELSVPRSSGVSGSWGSADHMSFPVGEGLDPIQKLKAEEVVKKQTIPVGQEIKLPFMQAGVTVPSTAMDSFLKGAVEYPERLAKSGAEFFTDTIHGRTAETPQNKAYNVTTIQQEMADMFAGYANAELPWWTVPLTITGAFLDLSIAGSFVKSGVKSLASGATDAEVRNAWDFLGRPKTMQDLQTTYRELQRIYHPDKPGGSVELSSAINSAKTILETKGIPKTGILPSMRNLAQKLETPVQDLFKTDYTRQGYAGTKGLLTEIAGQEPTQPFQPNRQPNMGLSIREVPEKPIKTPEFVKAQGTEQFIKLKRGDAKEITNFSLSKTDPNALFGQGFYLTDSARVAKDYTAKSGNVLFRTSGTKENALNAYIRKRASYLDTNFKSQFVQTGYSGSPKWEERLEFAKKQVENELPNLEIRKLGDGDVVIREKTNLGKVSELNIPKDWFQKTIKAEEEIKPEVADALARVFDTIGERENADLLRNFSRADFDTGLRPSFRDVYSKIPGDFASNFRSEQGQKLFREYLGNLGYKGIEYQGGITIGGAGKHKAYVFFDEQGIKKANQTKSQLTDIWEKANKGVEKIPQITYKELDDLATKIKSKDTTIKNFNELSIKLYYYKQAIDGMPGKNLVKYMSRTTGELPEVTGKPTKISLNTKKSVKNSEFGIRGDDIVTELGFTDIIDAQEGLDQYLNMRSKLNNVVADLSSLRKEKSAIKKGELLMQLAKGDRRVAYRAIKGAFNLSEYDLASIRQGKDIMAMSKEEFDSFLKIAEKKAMEIEKRGMAMVDFQATIQERDLRKWENVQSAMKLPPISEMTIDQINQLNDVLSQYKVGDEFLPIRQLETISETEMSGIRTVREVQEHLAKKYNLTPEQLPPIKPHPWMYDTQLARQNPLYDLLVDKYNISYLKANGRILELERESDELIKLARDSRQTTILEKISQQVAPTDKYIVEWLEADEGNKKILEEKMTDKELAAAKYQDKIYHEYYDWLSRRAMDKKFSSRFEDKYFPHTRRGILEAWKEDGFIKAFSEAKNQFIQEEKLLTILDEKTKEILPYQKWVGFTQYRTDNLIPTKNAARAFKTYITALEKARQFDEFIPEVMIYVHSLTPRTLTTRGVEMDDSVKRFVKSWINTKKGRIEKQIVKPGGRMDWALRMGVAITRIRDLGLNIPVGIANIFGEQAGNLTMLGAKNYSSGVARRLTISGREIIKKYPEFIGKSFWEGLTEASNNIGDQFMSGFFGLFGAASRRGNEIFLLGSMTPQEYASKSISVERLAELRKLMGRYRVVEDATSVFGKSAEAQVGGQYKKWAIPILTTTANNAKVLVGMLRSNGLSALKSKEGSELFYSVILGSVLGLGTYGYYNKLKDKKSRNFVEDVIYKSIRDSLSLIGALDPKFLGSFTAPRLAAFIVDLTTAIDDILFLEKKSDGSLKGINELKSILTPVIINQLIPETATIKKGSGGGSGNFPSLKLPSMELPSMKMPSMKF